MRVVLVASCLALCCTHTCAVATASAEHKETRDTLTENDVSPYSFENFADDILQCNSRGSSFFQAASSSEPGLGECLRRRAVSHLIGLSSGYSPVGISDSVTLVAEPGSRGLPHYNEPPSLVEAMRLFLGHRIMRWQLDALYPGLVMRVGPMGVPEAGVLEFVLERLYDETDRGIGPGRLLVKRTILPLLLGLKLKLSTLMPLFLGTFFFLATKAVFFSKLAILFGAMLGFKALLFGGYPYGIGGGIGGGHYPIGHSHHSTGNLLDLFTGGHHQHHHNPYGPVSFKSSLNLHSLPDVLDPNNVNIPRDVTGSGSSKIVMPSAKKSAMLPGSTGPEDRPSYSGSRNFAWDDKERGMVQ